MMKFAILVLQILAAITPNVMNVMVQVHVNVSLIMLVIRMAVAVPNASQIVIVQVNLPV